VGRLGACRSVSGSVFASPIENNADRFEAGKITEKVVLTPENIAKKLRYIAGNGHD